MPNEQFHRSGSNLEGRFFDQVEGGQTVTVLIERVRGTTGSTAKAVRDHNRAELVARHPAAWAAYQSPPAPANPFDHDGDGKPGGSLPKAKRKAAAKPPRAAKPKAAAKPQAPRRRRQ